MIGSNGFWPAVVSEFTKLRTVRSTAWTLVAAVLFSVAVSVANAASEASSWAKKSAAARAVFDPTNSSLAGVAFGCVAIGVVGVLSVSSEYTTGTIRSTFTGTPRRGTVLRAKALVLGVCALVIGELITFAAFLAGQAVLSGKAEHATLGDPGVLRALLLTGLVLAGLALAGQGLGCLVRYTAGGVAAIVGLLFALPILAQALPTSAQRAFNEFTPLTILASSVSTTVRQPHNLAPWAGAAAVVAYAFVLIGVGGVRLRRGV
jgi:ABC-type transport system involved in multi-copper enzyme maturation permease subunit